MLSLLGPPPAPAGLGPEAQYTSVGWGAAWRLLADRPLRAAAKRAVDLVIGTAALLLVSPIVIVVALAVKLTSPGPILYRQTRLARGGGTFRIWKFRTMVSDAEARLAELLASDPAAAEAYARDFKLKDDPRITVIGGTLRRLSVDELPQLLNVLRGDMSLVGPRPKLLDEADEYGEYLDTVLLVRPGMTGIWQISGRNNLPYWRRVQLDALYVREYTIVGDLVIMASTVTTVLRRGRTGAY